MSTSDIAEHFSKLRLWSQQGQQAPHKPLLLLFMLARVQRGEPRLVAWYDLEVPLRKLITDFGPPRKSVHPEHPFWRLRNDADGKLWEVPEAGQLATNNKGDVRVTDLRKHGVHAGFTLEVDTVLRNAPDLVEQIAARLLNGLEAEDPDKIREAVGLL